MARTRPLAVLLPLLFLAIPAGADEPKTAAGSATDPFSQGTWTLQLYGAGQADFTGSHTKLASGTVGVGYYFWNDVSLNIEATGFYVDQPGPDAYAGSLKLALRQHLIVRDPWSIFLDVGGSIFEANRNTPPGGTHFNFNIETGVGATYRLADKLFLLGGVRYFHLSNAHVSGAERNPSFNGVQPYLGILLTP